MKCLPSSYNIFGKRWPGVMPGPIVYKSNTDSISVLNTEINMSLGDFIHHVEIILDFAFDYKQEEEINFYKKLFQWLKKFHYEVHS